jgi:hypothetical protein
MQSDLFSYSTPFDGKTYNPERDYPRLNKLLRAVFDLMKDGRERSLCEISGLTGGSEASVSARLRDLRKPKYGGHTVTRRHIHDPATSSMERDC